MIPVLFKESPHLVDDIIYKLLIVRREEFGRVLRKFFHKFLSFDAEHDVAAGNVRGGKRLMRGSVCESCSGSDNRQPLTCQENLFPSLISFLSGLFFGGESLSAGTSDERGERGKRDVYKRRTVK